MHSTPTAFVVDDEPTLCLVMAEVLRREGYSTHSFTKPAIALQRANEVSPDLLVCDVFMPGGMTGIELAVVIKTMNPSTKVLILSALTELDDLIDEAHSRGYFFAYLTKPVYPKELLDAVRSITL